MFKGPFKFINSVGKPYTYSIGDVVYYQGKFWECLKPTESSPLQDSNSWKFTGNTQNTITENPPVNPFVGQVWTSTNGVSYVWYEDVDGYQWVET
jgi:hypothetical protein